MADDEIKEKFSFKKTFLIILTILILGPIVFFGSCFPVGIFVASMGSSSTSIAILLGLAVGIFLAIFICSKIIKKIESPTTKIPNWIMILVIFLLVVLILSYLFPLFLYSLI